MNLEENMRNIFGHAIFAAAVMNISKYMCKRNLLIKIDIEDIW